MAQFAIKKLSFIGGSLRPVGAVVDIDETILKPRDERKAKKADRDDNVIEANSNLAPAGDAKAIAVVEMAAIGPTGPNPTAPQQVPPGTVQTAGGHFYHGTKLVGEGSEAAANAPDASETTQSAVEEEGTISALDHDGDGKKGGSKKKS